MAALACACWSDAATAAPATPENLLLRLSDLPAGYVVGDDTGCGFTIGEEEAPDALEEIDSAHASIGCGIDFERAWVARGARRGPPLIEATAFAVDGPDGAAEAYEVRETLIDYATGVSRESLRAVPVAAPLGDAAAAYTTDDALVHGRTGRPGVVVVWRSGPLLAMLLIGGRPEVAGPETALALAAAQQRRMASPTPLKPGENDSTLVPLDDPELGIPVHWLGASFDPPGALPAVRVDSVHVSVRARHGPGSLAEIEYAGDAPGAHVSIGLWQRRRFARFRAGAVGRRLFDRDCVAAERLRLRRGHAVVRTERCGRRTDFVFAHAVIGRTIVTLNMPICTMCLRGGRHRTGYETRAGLTAVLRGLVRRR